jgi:hypothetical protein
VRKPTVSDRAFGHTAVVFNHSGVNVVANYIGAGLLGLPVFVMGFLLCLSAALGS